MGVGMRLHVLLLSFILAHSDFHVPGCTHPVTDLQDSDGKYITPFTHSKALGHCQLDSYDILGEIGRGNFGKVVRAVQKQTGRLVAIKFQQHLDQKWYLFNRNEECIHAELSRPKPFPYVVEHFGSMVLNNGTVGYVMELVEGSNLKDLVKAKKVSALGLQKVMAQLAITLEMMHSRGIIMADLKPGNIMVTKSGDIKVHDFGLATKTFPNGSVLKPSEWVSYRIMPEYGNRPNVDWYAYGLFLFEVLNGEGIFEQLEGPNAHKSPLIRGGFCPASFSAVQCDFIKKFSKAPWDEIWGLTAETRRLLQSHPFFDGLDWTDLNSLLFETL